ncbi:DUF3251 domain-containing protein [Lonsdalea populi]|uniref:DUF3251 domain-containing protein n=1 Tax=Lonsdalea populi TaxID=1172565 RepID=UPI000A236F08|nr:DUF3251 domain-containing protein [Lonsdalea populi]OSM98067.1 hypothetical protein AU508_04485 [Lonsdalea populi]RAT69927.1 hypothetical protein AU504_09445 [Lonsdalea populi]RAT73627.1 hypothetical protein AU505_04445 [Lonsdalea populi]RAT74008.1 hypothetical protein AU506_13140 [Lonsdalea populi]RAT78518.1 hypothetical protein AU507_08710 [Lonsdalea populi]
MTARFRLLTLLPTLIALAGCAQQQPLPQVQQEISQLNQRLQTLAKQAVALKRQNALNAHSDTGVYLLPAAKNYALVDSAIGRLSVSLSHVSQEASGTHAQLHIRLLDGGTLPNFRAHLDWGELDASGKPLTEGAQTQSFAVTQTLLPKWEAAIALRLTGLSPEQLGFIRLYDIEKAAAVPRPNPMSSPAH